MLLLLPILTRCVCVKEGEEERAREREVCEGERERRTARDSSANVAVDPYQKALRGGIPCSFLEPFARS